MLYYEPIKIEYTDEQLLRINNFLDKYNNDLEFKEVVGRINEQANKTFRRRNDKKNKRK